MQNRPNEADFKIAEKFVKVTYERFFNNVEDNLQVKNPNISEEKFKNLGKMVKRAIKHPSRRGEECILCGECSDVCPANSMDYTSGEADSNTCIRCFKCVVNCPEKILRIDDLYPIFLKFEKLVRIPDNEDNVKSIYYI